MMLTQHLKIDCKSEGMRDRQRQRIWLLVNEGKARVDDNVGGDKVIVRKGGVFLTPSANIAISSHAIRVSFFLYHSSHTPRRMQEKYSNFVGQRRARPVIIGIICASVYN